MDTTFWDEADRHLIRYGRPSRRGSSNAPPGSYVYDSEGTPILDFTSGQMSAILGHAHPDIVSTVSSAVASLDHLFSGMLSAPGAEAGRPAHRDPARPAEQGHAAEHRRRVERGRDQDGQALHRPLRDRLVRPLVARHDAGRGLRDLLGRAPRLRPADAGQSRPARPRTRTGPRSGAATGRTTGRPSSTTASRSSTSSPPAASPPASSSRSCPPAGSSSCRRAISAPQGDVRGARHAAHPRRGADRPRPHRRHVRVRAGRRRPGHPDAVEDPGRRAAGGGGRHQCRDRAGAATTAGSSSTRRMSPTRWRRRSG